MGDGLGRVTKHPEYYLSDGSVSFLTGATLFRVHKSFFERESDVFRDLFVNAAEDDPQSGTDARPFTLDVTSDEFAQLLWVWYDREYLYQQQSNDKWITILRLSTRWGLQKIKDLAVRELWRTEKLMHILQVREDALRKAGKLDQKETASKFFKQILNHQSNDTSTGSGGQASDLNGERAYGTTASASMITLGEPQVPDRARRSAGAPPSHPNNYLQTGNEGSQEKGKGKEAKSKNAREQAKEGTS